MDCTSETGYPLDNSHQTDNTSYFENGTILILDEQSIRINLAVYPSNLTDFEEDYPSQTDNPPL